MIKITSWNVNEQEFNNIKIGENDIILLQEFNSKNVTDEKDSLLNQHFNFGQYFNKNNITDMEKGYIIMYGKNFVIENNNIKPQYINNIHNLRRSTDWIFLNKKSNKNDKYAIISVHLPFSKNEDDKFNIINSIIEEGNTYIEKGYIVIIGGDFNIKSDAFKNLNINNFKCNYDTNKITNNNIKIIYNKIDDIQTFITDYNTFYNEISETDKNILNKEYNSYNIHTIITTDIQKNYNDLKNIGKPPNNSNINIYNEILVNYNSNINNLKDYSYNYLHLGNNNYIDLSKTSYQGFFINQYLQYIINKLKDKYINPIFQERIDYILYSSNAVQIGDESVEWYKINGNDTLDKYDHAKISINIIPIKDLNDIKHNNNFISSKYLNIQLYNDIKNNSYKEDFYNKIKF